MAKVKTFEDLETNVLYIMTYAMDQMVNDIERKFSSMGGSFHQYKKMLFKRYLGAVRQVAELSRQLTTHVEEATAQGRYKDLDLFAADGNEMARLLLSYADKSEDPANVEAVFKCIHDLPGGTVVTDAKLKRFFLR